VTQENTKKHETRKLSYRKDDRAMRPMYGCPEKFRESLTTPMATFLEICNGHYYYNLILAANIST